MFWDGGVLNLFLDYMLPEGLILVSRTAFVIGDMRSPTVSTFWFPFIFVRAVFMRMCFLGQVIFVITIFAVMIVFSSPER